ncbi:MAG: sigma 54-interacting transcriptional regulator [Polyangiaceae bacterium]
MEPTNRLGEELHRAQCFEDAAEATLEAALHAATEALERSAYSSGGRILRAMLHLRPDDGYVRLVVLEMGERGPQKPCHVGDANHLPSATAWRWVKQLDSSIAVDVERMEVKSVSTGARAIATDEPRPFEAESTTLRLTGREATHLFVVPLRAPGRRIEGMLSIEACCRKAIGTPFIWEVCGPTLSTLVGVASPYLTRLPITRVEPTATDSFLPVIGRSMQQVVEMLGVFAQQTETILLSGPTGAGKSRLARWCHERSPAASQNFETIDLATVPEELQMAELFGWRKGAFTSAAKDTPGCIARAEKGTLFVDEIDKLSLKAQAGLLRVLEERRYRPFGEGTGDRDANVRFIIGTNADLHQLVQDGQFRSDLYYRINVLPVRIPALRERCDEVVAWAQFMLNRRHSGSGSPFDATIAPEAGQRLLEHDWPGNLRQLDNIVRRAYALSLVDQIDGPKPIVLQLSHIERALSYEGTAPARGLWEHLARTAEVFVDEVERRADAVHGLRLDMDHAEVFKWFVIEAARRRLGGDEKEAVRRAFILLGKEAMVQSRNHKAQWKREEDKMLTMRAILQGRDPGAPGSPAT